MSANSTESTGHLDVVLVKGGRTKIRYSAELLADDGTRITVRAPWAGDVTRDFGFVRFESGDVFTEYYWRDREPVPVVSWAGSARDERMAEKFLPLRNPAGATWLVVSRVHELAPEGNFERWVQATWGAPIGVYPGVRIYRIAAPVR